MVEVNKLKNLNLLYVEDNKNSTDTVKTVFGSIFNKLFITHDGNEGLKYFDENHIDIIISDINMPNLNGIEMCKQIRKKSKKVSIIFLTAFSDKETLLDAVNLQIDGYLVKPINFEKLNIALLNILEKNDIESSIIFYNEIKYSITNKELEINGEIVPLGPKEHLFINYLAQKKNRVITKEELAYNVWPNEYMTESSLKSLVYHLRKKIGKDCISNVTGLGYKLNLK